MATIRKRRKKWQVIIRRKGCPHIVKTLHTYADANKFAQESEDKINKGLFQDLSEAQQTLLATHSNVIEMKYVRQENGDTMKLYE